MAAGVVMGHLDDIHHSLPNTRSFAACQTTMDDVQAAIHHPPVEGNHSPLAESFTNGIQ